MDLPYRLRDGDTVAIIAPSSPYTPGDVDSAMMVLDKMGLVPRLMTPGIGTDDGSITPADTDVRLREFIAAVRDPNVRAIFAAQGGLGASELLPLLPYGDIGAARKIIMGFSDVTALLCAIGARSNLVTFCGPTAGVRSDSAVNLVADSLGLVDAVALLMTPEPWGTKPFLRRLEAPVTLHGGRAAGRCIGGNLTVLCHLLGTPFMPDLTDAILFLEDVDVGGGELRRMLSHLDNAGLFIHCNGVVFGEFSNEPRHDSVPDCSTTLRQTFKSCGVPVLAGLNFSHGPTMACLPVGAEVAMDADKGIVWFGQGVTDAD